MQPLGLDYAGWRAYHAHVLGSHRATITVDVLDMQERLIKSLPFTDGQVNIQRDATIRRTLTLTAIDDGTVTLDPDNPARGALFADNMLRVRHEVTVPGVGEVEAVPFVGPLVKLTRVGGEWSLECQDKAMLAAEGCPPWTVRRGANVADAIENLFRARTGERHFRLLATKRRTTRAYNVGWSAEASPWKVAQRIAKDAGLQLFYSGDGYLVLREKPDHPVLTLPSTALISEAQIDYDLTTVKNYVRVKGATLPAKKYPGAPKDQDFALHGDPTTVVATARPREQHPMSPERLGRHGVPRFLSLLTEESGIKKTARAQARANAELARLLPVSVTTQVSGIPVFHLDTGDRIEVQTDRGDIEVAFEEASLPLGTAADGASYGRVDRVGKVPHRRKPKHRRRRPPGTNMPGDRGRGLPRGRGRTNMPGVR